MRNTILARGCEVNDGTQCQRANALAQIVRACFALLVAYLLVTTVTPRSAVVHAASGGAKVQGDLKGYTFIANRDEIIAQAKKEGRLKLLAEMEPPTIKATTKAFLQRYPFINLEVQEISGTNAVQANLLEIKSGAAKNWD